ncbi:MAG: septum formation initiator family protein [Comamonas sp.]|jgi:cell division protein FtsB|uniref:Cell division protein FtsB n=1 Tax=Comamonas guangdongensis TaxID=510515 RepID=A0ABV3ZQP6_9BURK|nr:septum formation initiator family protein [Comamonas sp.]
MVNRVVCVVLLALLAAIHAQLWLGHGSMAYVQELQQQIKDQYAANALEKSENDRLESEVNDLKDGLSTVEEKARYELGMVKANEIFIQVSKR